MSYCVYNIIFISYAWRHFIYVWLLNRFICSTFYKRGPCTYWPRYYWRLKTQRRKKVSVQKNEPSKDILAQRIRKDGEVAVAQLVERSLPIPEVCGSHPVIGKIYIEHLLTCLLSIVLKRQKISIKRPGMAHFFKNVLCYILCHHCAQSWRLPLLSGSAWAYHLATRVRIPSTTYNMKFVP